MSGMILAKLHLVSGEEFRDFVESYPFGIEVRIVSAFNPPFVGYFDCSLGKGMDVLIAGHGLGGDSYAIAREKL